MPVSSPKEFIEQILPQKLTPEKTAEINLTIQFNITGEQGGEWFAKIENGKVEINTGSIENPTISIKMKDRDFVRMVNGELSGKRAFMSGKLKFKGDMGSALKLQKLGII